MTSRCCLATGEYAAAACRRVNPWARAGEAPSSQNGRAAGAAGGPIHLALGESSVRIGPLRSAPVSVHPDPAAGRLLRPSAGNPGRVSRRRRYILTRLPHPIAAAKGPVTRLPDHCAHARRWWRHEFRMWRWRRRRGDHRAWRYLLSLWLDNDLRRARRRLIAPASGQRHQRRGDKARWMNAKHCRTSLHQPRQWPSTQT
jgi:hypothetical protein